MKSVWQETDLPQFPQLDEDIRTDVLIIGGGIAGILTAYFLRQNGIKYMLVEKDRICGENTRNTTAKITVQHGLYTTSFYGAAVSLPQSSISRQTPQRLTDTPNCAVLSNAIMRSKITSCIRTILGNLRKRWMLCKKSGIAQNFAGKYPCR